MANREQQRQNARDQRRIERLQKLRQQNVARPPSMAPGKRPARRVVTPAPAQRPSRLPSWWPWAAAGAVLVVLVALFFVVDPLGLRAPLPGKTIASQGNLHVNVGETHAAYSTDPPTSGSHFPTVPQRGIY